MQGSGVRTPSLSLPSAPLNADHKKVSKAKRKEANNPHENPRKLCNEKKEMNK